MFGMTPGLEDLGDERSGGGSDLLGPSREALGRPLLGEPAVFLRHVFGHGGMSPAMMGAHMAGDALAAVEELDGVGGESGVGGNAAGRSPANPSLAGGAAAMCRLRRVDAVEPDTLIPNLARAAPAHVPLDAVTDRITQEP